MHLGHWRSVSASRSGVGVPCRRWCASSRWSWLILPRPRRPRRGWQDGSFSWAERSLGGQPFLPLDFRAFGRLTNALGNSADRTGVRAIGQRGLVAPEISRNCAPSVQPVKNVPDADALDALDDVFPGSAATLSGTPTSTLVEGGDRSSACFPSPSPGPGSSPPQKWMVGDAAWRSRSLCPPRTTTCRFWRLFRWQGSGKDCRRLASPVLLDALVSVCDRSEVLLRELIDAIRGKAGPGGAAPAGPATLDRRAQTL